MAFPKGARAGLLLFLTAGPFLVFLFLHLFGKNHFEIDRYPVKMNDLFVSPTDKILKEVIFIDTNRTYCNKSSLNAQLERIRRFGEDIQPAPDCRFLNSEDAGILTPDGADWFRNEKLVNLESARSKGKKKLPPPPRAMLFDQGKNLRGVYGLCEDKSVDTLMLEYRILISDK